MRALAALPEDWGSIPSTYMAVHTVYNSSSSGSRTLIQTFMWAKHQCILKKKKTQTLKENLKARYAGLGL